MAVPLGLWRCYINYIHCIHYLTHILNTGSNNKPVILTCVPTTSRFISCVACLNASTNVSCSTFLNSAPGNTSRMRASNRLLSANVSLERVLSRRACTSSSVSFTGDTRRGEGGEEGGREGGRGRGGRGGRRGGIINLITCTVHVIIIAAAKILTTV